MARSLAQFDVVISPRRIYIADLQHVLLLLGVPAIVCGIYKRVW